MPACVRTKSLAQLTSFFLLNVALAVVDEAHGLLDTSCHTPFE